MFLGSVGTIKKPNQDIICIILAQFGYNRKLETQGANFYNSYSITKLSSQMKVEFYLQL